MRRTLLRISLCLVLGVLITLGVAWICAASTSWRGEWTSTDSGWLWPERAASWGAPSSRWTARRFGAESIEVAHEFPVEQSDGVVMMAANRQSTRRAGWPLFALETRDQFPPQYEWRPHVLSKNILINSFAQGLSITRPASQDQIILPLKPRWPGFAIDTAVYAALAYALGMGIAGIRRGVRRRRGRCLRCGYALHDLAMCPECGTPVSNATS